MRLRGALEECYASEACFAKSTMAKITPDVRYLTGWIENIDKTPEFAKIAINICTALNPRGSNLFTATARSKHVPSVRIAGCRLAHGNRIPPSPTTAGLAEMMFATKRKKKEPPAAAACQRGITLLLHYETITT